MKRLTMAYVALARLKAHKKSYAVMGAGIFLSVLLVTTVSLSLHGIVQAKIVSNAQRYGKFQAFVVNTQNTTDDAYEKTDLFEQIGHCYVVGKCHSATVGFADPMGTELLNYAVEEGRLPEREGEIAADASLLKAEFPDAALGETISMAVSLLDGREEQRQYVLTGIIRGKWELNEGLRQVHDSAAVQFPELLLSSEESGFTTGRTVDIRLLSLKDSRHFAESLQIQDMSGELALAGFSFVTARGEIVSVDQFIAEQSSHREIYEMRETLLSGILIGIALLISCCVGIASAVDSQVQKRQEEVSILRAVGATKRQIVRIFGCEPLLLTVVLLPLALIIGCFLVKLASLVRPEQISFRPAWNLLGFILVLSVVTIFVSSWIPLCRATNKSPMSVARDTTMLRKAKRIQSKDMFSVPALIAKRQRLFYGKRLWSVSLLIVLMLFSIVLTLQVGISNEISQYKNQPDLELRSDWNYGTIYYQPMHPENKLRQEDLGRIRRLPKVQSVEERKLLNVNLLYDGNSAYLDYIATVDRETWIERNVVRWKNPDDGRKVIEEEWVQSRAQYETIQRILQTEQNIYPDIAIASGDILEDSQAMHSVLEGKIDRKNLDRGEEVVVCVPKRYAPIPYADTNGKRKTAKVLAENDFFHVGDQLHLIQLYGVQEDLESLSDGDMHRKDLTLTVGAVVEDCSFNQMGNGVVLLTTPAGMEKLGAVTDQLVGVEVMLDPDATMEDAQLVENHLNAVWSIQGRGVAYNNYRSLHEARVSVHNTVMLFLSITVVFFVTACAIILSGILRRIQAERQQIGMLRAVGADAAVLVQCYNKQAFYSIGVGTGTAMLLLTVWYRIQGSSTTKEILLSYIALLVMAALLWILCRIVLHRAVDHMVQRSIVNEIREG